jgi:hypothetical protein
MITPLFGLMQNKTPSQILAKAEGSGTVSNMLCGVIIENEPGP